MSLDPTETYVLLNADGAAAPLPGGAAFWSSPEGSGAQCGDGWLVSEYLFDRDWPTWEMHPEGDEFVYLLSGEADLHLDLAAGTQVIVLAGRGAVLVPRGVWHTARIKQPCRILHITRGAGTQTRPV